MYSIIVIKYIHRYAPGESSCQKAAPQTTLLRARRRLAAGIHVELLRTLLGDNVAISARGERDLGLTLVEAIICLVQGVGQTLHLAARV